MAVYKVIQDVEAEDKLLGPLTLKGFVYAVIALGLGFINFRLALSGAIGPVKWLLILIFLGPMILFGVLASPLGREQPTEVWLLSRLRFLLKSRKRIWNQSGDLNPVTITAPKRVERNLTKNLSQTEVASRLEALATTLDSRGWAIKNVNVNLNTQPNYFQAEDDSDRLVAASTIEQPMQVVEVHAADDILDEQSNPTAQNFQNLMVQADEARKAAAQDRLNAALAQKAAQPAPKQAASVASKADAPLTAEEQKVLDDLHAKNHMFDQAPAIIRDDGSSVTVPHQAVKLELAQSGNAFSVATIARLASHSASAGGEVSVPLH